MDWYPLFNSIRISLIASTVTFFVGIGVAYALRNVRPWRPFVWGGFRAVKTLETAAGSAPAG